MTYQALREDVMNWVQMNSKGVVGMHLGSLGRHGHDDDEHLEDLDALRKVEPRPRPGREGSAPVKFAGKCFKCDQVGHTGFECRKFPAAKAKAKPKAKAKAGYRGGGRRAAGALEEDEEEVTDDEGNGDLGIFEADLNALSETESVDESSDEEEEDTSSPADVIARLVDYKRQIREDKEAWKKPKTNIQIKKEPEAQVRGGIWKSGTPDGSSGRNRYAVLRPVDALDEEEPPRPEAQATAETPKTPAPRASSNYKIATDTPAMSLTPGSQSPLMTEFEKQWEELNISFLRPAVPASLREPETIVKIDAPPGLDAPKAESNNISTQSDLSIPENGKVEMITRVITNSSSDDSAQQQQQDSSSSTASQRRKANRGARKTAPKPVDGMPVAVLVYEVVDDDAISGIEATIGKVDQSGAGYSVTKPTIQVTGLNLAPSDQSDPSDILVHSNSNLRADGTEAGGSDDSREGLKEGSGVISGNVPTELRDSEG